MGAIVAFGDTDEMSVAVHGSVAYIPHPKLFLRRIPVHSGEKLDAVSFPRHLGRQHRIARGPYRLVDHPFEQSLVLDDLIVDEQLPLSQVAICHAGSMVGVRPRCG